MAMTDLDRLKQIVAQLGAMSIDDFPHTRLARAAGELVGEWRAWERKEYPYDKADRQ